MASKTETSEPAPQVHNFTIDGRIFKLEAYDNRPLPKQISDMMKKIGKNSDDSKLKEVFAQFKIELGPEQKSSLVKKDGALKSGQEKKLASIWGDDEKFNDHLSNEKGANLNEEQIEIVVKFMNDVYVPYLNQKTNSDDEQHSEHETPIKASKTPIREETKGESSSSKKKKTKEETPIERLERKIKETQEKLEKKPENQKYKDELTKYEKELSVLQEDSD